ncbi:MAG: peptidyl-prolyl cis-trans isomerase A (cyclophilin A) [Sphingobacteriales bacterium]|jgi:peptidyl-prolyl cis-trans isomerase A (cyclophilin A)
MLFFTFSCQNSQKPSVSTQKTLPVEVNVKKKKKAPERLISDNIVDFLTDFEKSNPEQIVKISTPQGDLKVRLYDNTPLHRANFIYLSKLGYYDNTVFYRVVPKFMIQGGDSDGFDHAAKKKSIGNYKLPPEIRSEYYHKRGALAMARPYDDNPGKKSSAFVFYIVGGAKYSEKELQAIEKKYEITIPENQRITYKNIGGSPHLDGQHTIFGEVIDGDAVIDKIAGVKTDKADWPIDDVSLKVEVIK